MRYIPLLGWLLFSALPAGAAIGFSSEAGVRVSSGVPQVIVSTGPLFRMYLVRDGFDVVSATSTDQLAWSEEPGVRLSTGLPADPDAGNIFSTTILALSGGGYRMLYAAKNSAVAFSVLSATSTDGIGWGKETGARLQADLGATLIQSVRVLPTATGHRLYYVRSNSGSNRADTFVASAVSTDEGLNWSDEGACLSTATAEISISTLTDGRVRLHYAALTGGATVAHAIHSAISANGRTFTAETTVAASTDTSTGLNGPLVVRSTETFRWRLFAAYTASGSSIPFVFSALTSSPSVTGLSPSAVQNTQTSLSFTLSGEVFAATPTVTITRGLDSVAATGVTYDSDLGISGTLAVLGIAQGAWAVTVVNPDGRTSSLANALTVTIPSGKVDLTDNLIRPRNAEKTTIDITTFAAGKVTAKLYTIAGEFVKTVFDGTLAAGTNTVYWSGDTSAGNTVASGVYLLHVEGPNTRVTKKIVVIK